MGDGNGCGSMLDGPIAVARHNKPMRYLTVALLITFNALFVVPMASMLLGVTEISSDPDVTLEDEAPLVLGTALMFVVLPWICAVQMMTFRVELTYEGILKRSAITGRVFIRYEDVVHVRYSNLLEWFVIRGPTRRIWMAPYLEGFTPFVNNLWKIAEDRRLPNLTKINILGMKYAAALGADLRHTRIDSPKGSLEDRVVASKIGEKELERMNEEVESLARAKKSYPYRRKSNTAAVLALSAGAFSAWPWLDMLFDPSYEEEYYANLDAAGWAFFAGLMTLALMGFVAVKMIVDMRFWPAIIATSMASVGIGAIFGVPALVLIVWGRREFRDSEHRRSTRRRWDSIPAIRKDLWDQLQEFRIESFWSMPGRPGRDAYAASATLSDGTEVPCVVFVVKDTNDQNALFPRHGFTRTHYKFDVEKMIDAGSVVSIANSPNVVMEPNLVAMLREELAARDTTDVIKVTMKDGNEYLTTANWFVIGVPVGSSAGGVREIRALRKGDDISSSKSPVVLPATVMLCIFRPPDGREGFDDSGLNV